MRAFEKLPPEFQNPQVKKYYDILRKKSASVVMKRVFDIVAALLILLFLLLPIAVIAVLVKCDSKGPAMFRQERVGKNGKPFRMLKLRTMYADAENNMERYFTPEQMAEWNTEHKVIDDPRVTRIGQLLRRTSLDELPQFINVLLGQMSVVGPRPVTRVELEWYGDDVDEILSVRQGITGYWQAFARNDATWESGERQEMELYYVRNVSASLDARIFFGTFGAIVGRTGR